MYKVSFLVSLKVSNAKMLQGKLEVAIESWEYQQRHP